MVRCYQCNISLIYKQLRKVEFHHPEDRWGWKFWVCKYCFHHREECYTRIDSYLETVSWKDLPIERLINAN